MTQLNSRKAQFDNALRAGKSPEEIATGEKVRMGWGGLLRMGESWKRLLLARRGLVFLGVKM
jgi:hypothetical protein